MAILRIVLVIFACLLVFGGLALLMESGGQATWLFAVYLLIGGTALLVGALFENGRYRNHGLPTDGWKPTGERFFDDRTGKLIEVDYQPETGQRRYREVEEN